jgi:hypothetical protein
MEKGGMKTLRPATTPPRARFAVPASAPSATLRGLQPARQSESLPPGINPTTTQTKSLEPLPKLT